MKYEVTIHVEADSVTEVEKLLDKTPWITGYDDIDEEDEIPSDDEDEVD